MEDEDIEDEGAAAEDPHLKALQGQATQIEVTPEVLLQLEEAAFKSKSVRGLKQLLSAFASACHMGEEADGAKVTQRKHVVNDLDVYNDLIVHVVENAHKAFMHHLFPAKVKTALVEAETEAEAKGISSNPKKLQAAKVAAVLGIKLTKADFRDAAKTKVWKPLQPIIYGFLRSALHALGHLTDKPLLHYFLKNMALYTQFLVPFPKTAKGYMKALLQFWGVAYTSDQVEEVAVQLEAFLRLREVTVSQPYPFIEGSLKGIYLSYVRNVKFTNEATLPSITFMGNCVVELYGLDMAASYQQAFVYIRQLALLLRQALTKQKSDATAELHRWQFVNSLKLWSAVLAAYPGEGQLKDLVYPLAQVITGVAHLSSSLLLAPLRFHCVRLLHQLAAAAACYIPTSQLLLDLILSPSMVRQPKPSTDAPPRLENMIRLGKDALRQRQVLDALLQEAVKLLMEGSNLYRYSPAYPEMVLPIIQLRKFVKGCKVPRWRTAIKGLIEQVEQGSHQAAKAREALPQGLMGPHSLILEACKPEGALDVGERHKKARERAEQDVVAAPSKANSKGKGKSKGKGGDSHHGDGPTSKKRKKKGSGVVAAKTKVQLSEQELEQPDAVAALGSLDDLGFN
ncbi:unnamed protein product [Chrysoparadoxa australica]